MDSASFDEIWKVTKNGYNKSQDPHFLRFRTDLLSDPHLQASSPGIWWGSYAGNTSGGQHTPH
jgi:hypothetical protein